MYTFLLPFVEIVAYIYTNTPFAAFWSFVMKMVVKGDGLYKVGHTVTHVEIVQAF